MVTVTYVSLNNFLGGLAVGTLPAARSEDLIDTAIDLLNSHNAGLDNMSGSEGSQTVTLTSAARGAVLNLAAMLYRFKYTNPQQTTMGPMGVGSTGTTQDDIDRAARRYGRLLVARSILRT